MRVLAVFYTVVALAVVAKGKDKCSIATMIDFPKLSFIDG